MRGITMKCKALVRVGALATTALLLSACASTPAEPEAGPVDLNGTTLQVLSQWVPASPQFAVQQKAIDELEAETGLVVELSTSAGEDLLRQVETSTFGGNAPDIVITNLVAEATGWLGNGTTVDVAPVLEGLGLGSAVRADALTEWADAEGRIQGVPLLGFVWPVWYNLDLLEEAGISEVPTTIEELEQAAADLQAAGIAPFVVGGSDWSGNKLFLQFVQGRVGADEFKELVSSGGWCGSPAAMAGIEDFVTLRDAGLFIDSVEGYTADQMNPTFYEGGAAMMSAGSWAFPGVPDGLNLALGGLPVPATDGAYTKPTAMQGNTSSGIFVTTTGAEDNLAAVEAFIAKFMQPAVAGQMAEVGSYTTAVLSDEAIEFADPLLGFAVNTLPSEVEFAILPDNFIPAASADALTRQTAAAFAPGASVDNICSGLDSAY